VEAVLNLMNRDNSSNYNLYFSFSHDTDIVPMVPALGIFPSPRDDPMPWDKYDQDRVFWTTSIVPMGGHVVVERLECGPSDTRVRVVVNERVQRVPGCSELDAPGGVAGSGVYRLDEFERVVRSRWDQGFCEACAAGAEGCIESISFFES
jgi:acid phosphatase